MPSLPHQRFTAAGLSEVVTAVVLAMTSALLFYGLTGVQPLGLDFAPIWAASSNPSAAYDAAAITDAQRGILNGLPGLRPFANPPTALLLALPFGLLPFSAAYIAFAAGGFVLFVWTARRAGSPWWVAIAPLVVLLLHIGQMSLVVGGLLLAGLCATDGRIRGLLIGLAAAIKPQLCLFIPLLLLFDRDWRGLAVAAATVGLLSAAATLAFGLDIGANGWRQRTSSSTSSSCGLSLPKRCSRHIICSLRWRSPLSG